MGIIAICEKYRELENIVNKAKEEIDTKSQSWQITGTTITDVINKLPF